MLIGGKEWDISELELATIAGSVMPQPSSPLTRSSGHEPEF